MATKALTFKRIIAAPAAEVYRMWTRAATLRLWFCDAAQIEARKGGRAYFGWNSGFYAAGRVTQAAPGKALAFTWFGPGEPAPTTVKVALREKAGRTTVTLTHGGLGGGKAWAKALPEITAGWTDSLENLQAVLETGEDLRIVRRPMLGITNMGPLDAETVARLGVPVKAGIRIGGTVPGLGAAAAGLTGDDVIVSIGGKKTETFGGLQAALNARKAGDTVPVVYYRGREKHTQPMTLSRRPLPPTPTDGAGLAASLRAIHEREMAALAEALRGATEAEAGRRPAPEEWSVKEILVHILTNERGLPDVLAELITDTGRWYDDFDNENVARPAAGVAVYPTLPALLEALRQAHAEQEAMCAVLPAEVFAKPRLTWLLALALLQGPTHVESHLAQINTCLTSARRAS